MTLPVSRRGFESLLLLHFKVTIHLFFQLKVIPLNAPTLRRAFGIVLMFSLWPDVDIKSIGQKLFYVIFFIVDIVLIFHFENYKAASYFGLLIILPILARHRGWTHSRITAIVLPLPLISLPLLIYNDPLLDGIPYYLCGVTGYFSHLFFDKKLYIFK